MDRSSGVTDLMLQFELWFRNRDKVTWKTKDGKEIPLSQLSDQHLENIIRYKREKEEQWEDYLDALSGIDSDYIF